MHIQAAFGWDVQHGLRQDLAKGRYNDQIRLKGCQRLLNGRFSERLGLQRGQAQALRALSYCAGLWQTSASGWAIGLGDNHHHLFVRMQRLKRGHSKIGGTHKNDTRAHDKILSQGCWPAAPPSELAGPLARNIGPSLPAPMLISVDKANSDQSGA
jgi:hypothetical protein